MREHDLPRGGDSHECTKPIDDPALHEALAAAGRGWRAFPVDTIAKRPRVDCWPSTATSNPAILRGWGGRWPGTGWGIATGAASGVIVLDVDPRHGGEHALDELVYRYGKLPDGPEVITGWGGRHFYFQHPGIRILNSAGKLGPGLDVRGDKGYVVAAGSRHASGRTYEWEWSAVPDRVPLPEAPDWLIELMLRGVVEEEGGTDSNPPSAGCCPVSVEGAIEATQPHKPGERNDHLLLLARATKWLPRVLDLSPTERSTIIVAPWWSRAKSRTSGQHTLRDCCREYEAALLNARVPFGGNPLRLAAELAKVEDDPPEASRYFPDDPVARFIVGIAAQLDRIVDGGELYLPTRAVADLIGTSRNTAARRINLIVASKLLELARKHTLTHATRYRWRGEAAR